MFSKMKNIDTAFRQYRLFVLLVTVCNCILCCFVIYRTTESLSAGQSKVHVIANGKLLEAAAVNRKDWLPVEIRDHVKMFHYYFFSLDPDEKVIQQNLAQALYLADGTAREQYENLKENGYFSNVISGNISQEIEQDSIVVNVAQTPYFFRYYGKVRIIRPTSIVTRSLITEGNIRVLDNVSDNNPHGFLIERWSTIENKDLNTQSR